MPKALVLDSRKDGIDMKFLKEPTKTWKKAFDAKKLSPADCPLKDRCFPCGVMIAGNAAGICSGLMPYRNDLDVVTLCMFSENMESKIEVERFSLTPDEAIEVIRTLVKTLDECFALHQPYLDLRRQNRRIFQQRRRRYKRLGENIKAVLTTSNGK